MNLSLNDSVSGRPRCRQWTPIITQQLRLRHLYQIIAYNLVNSNTTDGFHYTLHSTAMSAPFYTSEAIASPNPKWAELNLNDLQILACTGFVLRIWQTSEIKLTWGIHLSGLVYLGNRLIDIRPDLFIQNTVIFHMRGGFFTSCKHLKADLSRPLPYIDSLNLLSTENETKVFKLAAIKMPLSEIRNSYNLTKLKKLQSLQICIRNKYLSVYAVRDQINAKLNPVVRHEEHVQPEISGNIRYAPQLLTMTHLNKMLQDKPTRVQRIEIVKIQKEIEVSRLKNKILQHERDRKSGELRLLKEKFNNQCDDNEERNSQLMEDYRHLSKEIEKLREWKKEYIHQREILHQLTKKLQSRRRQLMSELLQLYPIHTAHPKSRYYINGVELPPSDLLVDCSDGGLSVALGYCSHLLIMCASFLQIPLRYPIRHFGSRSVIEDHSSPYHDKYKEFPLYTRGKDRMLFNNAVYLLNKNIAQYLHALGFKPPDLRATLPNLLMLLQGKDPKALASSCETETSTCLPSDETVKKVLEHRGSQENVLRPFANSCHHVPDPILDSLRHESLMQRSQQSPKRRAARNKNVQNPGLSQILAIPEAVLNKQMSGSTFLSYMKSDLSQLDQPSTSTNSDSESCTKVATNCDITKQPSIEEGTEMIPNTTLLTNSKAIGVAPTQNKQDTPEQINDIEKNNQKRLSRSVGSFDDEKCLRSSLESAGSEPLINVSTETNNSCEADDSLNASGNKLDAQQYDIQNWLDTGPNMVPSEENLYPDEYLGRTVDSPANDGHLTLRTDALVQRKSFNLVKPKF